LRFILQIRSVKDSMMSSGVGISVLFHIDYVSDSNPYHKYDLNLRSVRTLCFIPY
jgi:hypothetical protein